MRTLLLAAAMLAACACTQRAPGEPPTDGAPALAPVATPQSDAAGHRLEALTRNEDGTLWCTADDAFCLETIEDTPVRVSGAGVVRTLPPPGAPWPYMIRVDDSTVLTGLIERDEQMYSGGGASASRLVLYQVSANTTARVATLPYAGSADIRACFDEADEQQRAGACADIYAFVTRISLDESVAGGAPRIVLETQAATYPGRVTRQADSLERPPLTQADLAWAADETCSYRRIYSLGPDGEYTPDTPLPDCPDYLEP